MTKYTAAMKKRGRGRPRKKFYRPRKFALYTRSMASTSMTFTRWSANDATSNVHLNIIGSAAGNNIGSTVFKLSNSSGYGELQNLFDNYCIRKVIYRWVCTRNPDYTTTAGQPGVYPRLNWVHDFNDSTPISRLQMQQHPRMREVFFGDNFQKTRWYTLRPAALTTMLETGLATAYKPTWGAFVDTNDFDMAHYGIKYVYSQLYEGMNIYLEAKIVVQCKGIS